jgi:glutamate-1-semialdehyde 2,1-aminomutase
MKFWIKPSPSDSRLIDTLEDFLPANIFDIHAHLFHPKHCPSGKFPATFTASSQWDLKSHSSVMSRRLRKRTVHGLFFGYPSRLVDRDIANAWIASDIAKGGPGSNRALALASPDDDPKTIKELVTRQKFAGLKPYHVYANLPDTMQAKIEDFAPDWMWEICHDIRGILMLHIVRDRAIADKKNITSLKRLCRKYPRCQLVLAHIARSFNYRHAREGLEAIMELPNVVVDTALVTEPEAIRFALQTLGPERVLYGSDFPFSELRGKCTSVGDGFAWIYADDLSPTGISKVGEFTLLGIESLFCLREACESSGSSRQEVAAVFLHNAERLLGL